MSLVAEGFAKGVLLNPVVMFSEFVTSDILHQSGLASASDSSFLGKAAINGTFFYILDSSPVSTGFKLSMLSRLVFSQPEGMPRMNMSHQDQRYWKRTGYVVCAVSAATAGLALGPSAALYTTLIVKDIFSWITHEPLAD